MFQVPVVDLYDNHVSSLDIRDLPGKIIMYHQLNRVLNIYNLSCMTLKSSIIECDILIYGLENQLVINVLIN